MPGVSPSSRFWYWLRVLAIGRRPKWTLIRLAVLLVTTVIVFKYVLLQIRVIGPSMEPNFHSGTINFINRLAYVRQPPRRGDVIGIAYYTNADGSLRDLLLKRVVGLPGETISFSGGHVCVNGVRQDETYLKWPSQWNVPPHTLGSNEFYFVGDNRTMPPELHEHGTVTLNRIVGRVFINGNL
jgi:signal peptidase I